MPGPVVLQRGRVRAKPPSAPRDGVQRLQTGPKVVFGVKFSAHVGRPLTKEAKSAVAPSAPGCRRRRSQSRQKENLRPERGQACWDHTEAAGRHSVAGALGGGPLLGSALPSVPLRSLPASPPSSAPAPWWPYILMTPARDSPALTPPSPPQALPTGFPGASLFSLDS